MGLGQWCQYTLGSVGVNWVHSRGFVHRDGGFWGQQCTQRKQPRHNWAGKMAQDRKLIVAKHGHVCSIPRAHMVEGEKGLPRVDL